MSVDDVDDRQAAHAERRACFQNGTAIVRSAVDEGVHHGLELGQPNRPNAVARRNRGNAAHQTLAARRSRIVLAGIPAAIANSGMLPTTIAPAPTIASRPIRAPSVTTT